jgi:acylpyruvate hydrolase
MKLVTFVSEDVSRIGTLLDDEQVVVDLSKAAPGLPTNIIQFLEGGVASLAIAGEAIARADQTCKMDTSAVLLQSPVPCPGKIVCIGLNYRDHAAETGKNIPDYPTVFCKYANTVIGPGEPIVIPHITSKIDYEAELAFVIGKRGRYISREDALDYVAGYTAFNDVTARDFQGHTSQWTIGKSFDSFGPMGPVLVTSDEIPNPHELDIRIKVNGQVLQESNTRNLIFSIPQLIEYISQAMTLEPGDVISTGTPSGVGYARKPARYLQPGDSVEVEIEKIGRLVNPVVSEDD